MALVKGTVTENIGVGTVGTTATLSHNSNTGTDRLLVVFIGYASTNNCTAVTYNGVSMTKQGSWIMNDSGAGFEYDIWYLVAPATGSNNIVATMTAAGTIGMMGTTFTGAEQTTPLQSLNSAAATTPHTQSITISDQSMIMGIGSSRYSFDSTAAMTIDGTSSSFAGTDINGAIFLAQVCVWTRNANLSAGSKNVTTDTIANSFFADNTRIEIKAAAATPELTVSETTLSGFNYAEGSGPSAEQTFTVSGDDLTANATVTAPTNYEVSNTSGSGFGSSEILTQSGGDIVGEPVTIYVRLKAGLAEATYNGETLTVTSTGATTKNVTLNGEVTAAPATRRRIIIV